MYQKAIALSRSTEFKNLVVYGIGQGFNLLTPLLAIPYIISVCGLANYGKAAFAMALMFFLMVFVDFGSDIAGVKAVATNRDNEQKLQKILVTTYAAKSCMLLLVLVIMVLLFLFFPYFEDERTLFLLSLPILIGQLLNPTWFLQGVEHFTQITIINVLSKLLYVAGVFVFVKEQQDYIWVNVLWGVGMIVTNAASFLYLAVKFKLNFKGIRFHQVKEHLSLGFPIFSSQVFVAAQLYSPLIFVGLLGTSALAGIYRVVDQVIVIFKTYILLFFNFVFPRICYLLATDGRSGVRYWYRYNGLNFLFVSTAMALIHYFAEPIAAFFTDSDIASITPLLRIAVWIPVLMAISVPLKQLVLATNHNRFYVNLTIILVIGNVAAMALALTSYGISGVLYALIFTELLFILAYFARIKNNVLQPDSENKSYF
ncbi:MAG TPA: oligosaccharide flippase family protein [Flavobacterium sp.]|jgi:O-antigen/teichoic acid export membrane protein